MAQTGNGLRPIDLRHDLESIADLIGDAFAGDLDAAGKSSLREMHTLARMGPLLYLFVPPGGELGGFFRGFVWEEDGKVVGNVTLQQIDDYGRRWMIANVAVDRRYRGRGIARALMEVTLDRISRLSGEWALLQVRADNDIARGLYEHLGFTNVVSEHQLYCALPPVVEAPALPHAELTLLTDAHWPHVRALLSDAVPSLARWWQPTRQSGFRRASASKLQQRWGQLTGAHYRLRYGLWLDGKLGGVLDVDVDSRATHRIDVLLHPELSEVWSSPLLAYGLAQLHGRSERPVAATLFDYQQPAIAALEAWGFRATRTLITMRRSIYPARSANTQ